MAFLSRDQVSFVEDAGDTLHSQRNALDSGYVFNVNTDYSNPSAQPVRWLAEGRRIRDARLGQQRVRDQRE